MAGELTVSALDGLFKNVYGDDISDLIPRKFILQDRIKFSKKEQQLGNTFNIPVKVADSHGFTYIAAGDGVVSLESQVGMTMKNASVQGSQIILREQIDYEAAAKATSSKNAFKDAFDLVIEHMVDAHRKRVEIDLLYGQDELGTVASVSTNTITITTAEWAAGIWAGLEGCKIEAFNAAGTTQRTGTMVIASVDLAARTVTVDSAASGLTGTDRLFFKGARTTSAHKSCAGLHTILSNTGSLFGISAASYQLWGSSTFAAGSAELSREKLNAAIATATPRGLMGSVIVLVNPLAWGDLLDDESALRQYVDKVSGGKAGDGFVNGSESIKFFSQNGSMEIVAHPMVKEGYAYIFNPEKFMRVGATDVTMKLPAQQGQIFLHVSGSNAFELRSYSNLALFSPAPNQAAIVTGIVN